MPGPSPHRETIPALAREPFPALTADPAVVYPELAPFLPGGSGVRLAAGV